MLLDLNLLNLLIVACVTDKSTLSCIQIRSLSLGQSNNLGLPLLSRVILVWHSALLLLALGCRAETAVGENIRGVLLLLLSLLGQHVVGMRGLHQLLARLLEGLQMGLLLLESHLLLLVDDRLLDNGVYLLDGGARIVGQQDLLLPLDPLLLL